MIRQPLSNGRVDWQVWLYRLDAEAYLPQSLEFYYPNTEGQDRELRTTMTVEYPDDLDLIQKHGELSGLGAMTVSVSNPIK